ncbi:Xaa-Pro dipeptidase [uncultured archaeon]|nr:Xaa-Pro dipeptidase [uncultured archaeon]
MRKGGIYETRIEHLRQALEKKRLDAALLFSPESTNDLSSKSTYYLTGFFDSWPHAVLVTQKDAILFTGEPERAKKESAIKDIREAKKDKIDEILKKNRLKKIGVDYNFSFSRWNGMKKKLGNLLFTDISGELIELRAVKDSQELANIRHASEITAKALKVAEKTANSGDEDALANEIKLEFVNDDAETAFKPVVSGDKNSANIHYFACNQNYKKLVMVDIGAKWNFYNSDFTRTIILENERQMAKAYNSLKQLMGELSDFAKPGVKCIDAFNYAKKFLEKEGYKKESFANFHSLGHGVGLDVHEYPVLTSNPLFKDMKFEENMVFTLEPALYFAGKFGIRLEDTVVMGKNGVNRLQSTSL